MSENFEIKPGLLEQFRIEIKRIINAIASKDATIGSITNPDALGDNELVIWQDFKIFYRESERCRNKIVW